MTVGTVRSKPFINSKYLLVKMSGRCWSEKKFNRLNPDEPFGLYIYIACIVQCKNWDERRANEPGVQDL